MKLHLKNFRLYEDEIFDFGENGITLLSGPSGVGKSTIMLAISFALYGTGNKLQTIGKKSCSVELETHSIKIYRSKGPNRLVVNDVYEGDSGEAIIKEHFGKNFISYIPQDMKDSFVLMTPLNRLSFLEKIAFSDVDISKIKDDTRDLIKVLEKEHDKFVGSLEVSKKIYDMTDKPQKVCLPEFVKPSLKDFNKQKSELIQLNKRYDELLTAHNLYLIDKDKINTLNTNVESYNSFLKSLKEKIKPVDIDRYNHLKETLETYLYNKKNIQLRDNYNKMEKNILQLKENEKLELQNKLDKLEGVKRNIPSFQNLLSLEQQLEEYINYRDYNDKRKHFEECKTRLESMKVDEDKKNLSELETINIEDDAESWVEYYTQVEKVMTKKIDIERKISKLRKVDDPKDEIDVITREISELRDLTSTKVYTCPHCQNQSKLEKNNLVKYIGKTPSIEHKKLLHEKEERLIKLTRESENYCNYMYTLSQLQKELDSLSPIEEDDLDSVKEELNKYRELSYKNAELIKRRTELENIIQNKIYSPIIKKLEVEYKSIKVPKPPKDIESTDIDEEQLRQEIQTLRGYQSEYHNISSEIKNTESLIKNNIYSNTLKDMISKLSETRKTIDFSCDLLELDEDSVREELNLMDNNLSSNKILTSQIHDIDVKIHNDSEILSRIMDKWRDYDENSINVIEHALSEKTLLVQDIDKWITYSQEYKKWKNIKDEYTLNKTRELETREKLKSAELFKNKILEAESIILSNLVNNINSHLELFLEKFFPENPITVKLDSFKDTKTGDKPCINLYIEYKGVEHELNMLSGGEMSRVILAFTLVFSEIYNTPLILLDESTASLDQNSTSNVIDAIKEAFSDKLVLIIAHQVVEGEFDKIIKL